MILDNLLAFSVNQAITVSGTTQDSTNIIDLHVNSPSLPVLSNNQGARDIGIGDDPALKLLVQVTVAATTGTSMSVTLEGATDNGSGGANAFSVWWVSPAYALATLVAGARLLDMDMPRPPAGIAIPRFLKLVYTTVGACNPTVSAFIVLDRHDQYYTGTANSTLSGYPAGITIAN